MLEFVHFTGSDAGNDLQTRRKIRSQAMRDYRRRQREERESTSKSKEPTPQRVSSKGQQSSWHRRDRSSSISSSTNSDNPRKSFSRRASPRPDLQRFTSAERVRPISAFQLSSPALYNNYLFDDQLSAPQLYSQPDSTMSAVSIFTNKSDPTQDASSSHQKSSSWSASNDPFQSPAQTSQMLTFCKSYIRWLRPGISTDHVAEVLDHAWETAPNSMLLSACCLASVGHLEAVQPNRPGGNHAMYKARVLQEVGDRMKDPDLATSDETIGALALSTSFEMSRGSGEAMMHLQGLRSIVNMKGGIDAPANAGLSTMLETLDLIHAVTFDSDLIFTESGSSLGQSPLSESNISNAEIATRLMPILLAEQETFQQSSTQLSEKMCFYPPLLSVAASATEAIIETDMGPLSVGEDNALVKHFRSLLERFRLYSYQESRTTNNAFMLARTGYLEMAIYYNVIVKRIPYRHEENQLLVGQLYQVFQSVRDDSWNSLAYLKLKILLTGVVTSNNVTCRSYFNAQLVRCVYQMGDVEWRRVKIFITRFLAQKKVFETIFASDTTLMMHVEEEDIYNFAAST